MDTPRSEDRPSPRLGVLIGFLAGLAGAWIAAGSIGLLGHPFRRALVWAAMVGVVLGARPQPQRRRPFALAIVAAALAAFFMVGADLPVANVFAVALVLVAAAVGQTGVPRKTLLLGAEAVAILALYRLALVSIGSFWLAADSVAHGLGVVAGADSGQPLSVGPTFAGLDFLVVMGYLACRATLACGGFRRPGRFGLAVVFVLVGHLLYLSALSWTPKIVEQLPKPSPEGTAWNPYPPPPGLDEAVKSVVKDWNIPRYAPAVRFSLNVVFRIGQELRGWLPWNAPILAALLHLGIAWAILRWLARFADEPGGAPGPRGVAEIMRSPSAGLTAAAVVLAVLLPMLGNLCQKPGGAGLDNKKIVLYEKLYGNWHKPEYPKSPTPPGKDAQGNRVYVDWGRLAIGMYGMTPAYLESLGARVVISPDLSDEDLREAAALVVIFPDKPWAPGQIERIWQFVEGGGTLLVVGEHTILDQSLVRRHPELDETLADDLTKYADATEGRRHGAKLTPEEDELHRQMRERVRQFATSAPLNYFNELLEPTAIRVAYDSATFAVGGWLQSYEPLAHPITAGIGDAQNQFGAVIGASLDVRFPARPLLVGKWGWNDPGDPLSGQAMMGNDRYDAGERLGDVVLAAEQQVGKGRVVVLGDTSGLSNGLIPGCHVFTSRLYDYLVNPVSTPQDPWRQAAAALAVLALAAALVLFPRPERIAAVAVVAAAGLWLSTAATYRDWTVLPDGRLRAHRWILVEDKKWEQKLVARDAGGKNLPNNLAYLDAAHLGAYSMEQWRDDGLMGLAMTLMRNDYVPLMLPELTRERLLRDDGTLRARLLVSVAPLRKFTAGEREVLKEFLLAGGIFICTVGYEHQAPSRPLLSELGFFVGGRKWQYLEGTGEIAPTVHFSGGGQSDARYDAAGIPRPLGHFKSIYFHSQEPDFVAFVRFHAAWGVVCSIEPQLVVSYLEPYLGQVPLITILRYGSGVLEEAKGMVVVIGDSGFAMNKNLEVESGYPFEGMRENPVFWRWFLSLLRNGVDEGEVWFPKKIDTLREDAAEKSLGEGPPEKGQPRPPASPKKGPAAAKKAAPPAKKAATPVKKAAAPAVKKAPASPDMKAPAPPDKKAPAPPEKKAPAPPEENPPAPPEGAKGSGVFFRQALLVAERRLAEGDSRPPGAASQRAASASNPATTIAPRVDSGTSGTGTGVKAHGLQPVGFEGAPLPAQRSVIPRPSPLSPRP